MTIDTAQALRWLERHGTKKTVDGMARYGIHTSLRCCGVTMGSMRTYAKQIGKDHDLALELFASGVYEGQMLATLVDDPAQVTRSQMNQWAAQFDNWAVCDTACFHLFDRTPFGWQKAHQWTSARREFVKRAAFALMASLTVHDKKAPDAAFRELLPAIERHAGDERNFVQKAVSWALRSIGKRSAGLHPEALALAERLAESDEPAAVWVGKDARRELASAKVRERLKRKR